MLVIHLIPGAPLMTSDQVTAAAKAVGAVEDQLNSLSKDVVALDTAKAAQAKQQADAANAAQQTQSAVDSANTSVAAGQAVLQTSITAAVAALVALGASVAPPSGA
jgi:hypothetical protein